jgi:cytochrome c biogenesis protein CcmG, thiol:disulfide interchange protein DsbE
MCRAIAILLLASTACGANTTTLNDLPDLPSVTDADITALLTASEVPIVLNVWAAWCAPCRSEAPLLSDAAERFEGSVRFVGLNVRNSQREAKDFIAEFYDDTSFEHVYDSDGEVPIGLGGSRAVPLTFFFAAGGVLVDLHTGIVDERTLALEIDVLVGG